MAWPQPATPDHPSKQQPTQYEGTYLNWEYIHKAHNKNGTSDLAFLKHSIQEGRMAYKVVWVECLDNWLLTEIQ